LFSCGPNTSAQEQVQLSRSDLVGSWVGYAESGYSFLRLTLDESEGGFLEIYSYIEEKFAVYTFTSWSLDTKGIVLTIAIEGGTSEIRGSRSGVWWLDVELRDQIADQAMAREGRLYFERELVKNIGRRPPSGLP
jgi:hypothetical protein